jgi:hypothetical protein
MTIRGDSFSVSDVIATLSLIVAALSLLINIIPLWRDRARIDFSLYVAASGNFVGGRFVKSADHYAFRVVNSGRRPITITHAGGVASGINFFHYWFWRLTGRLAPTMFMLDDPGLTSLLKDKHGSDRTLNEGEYSSGLVDIDIAIVRETGGLIARQFHVIDSVGRYHRLSRRAHAALKRSIGELLTGSHDP